MGNVTVSLLVLYLLVIGMVIKIIDQTDPKTLNVHLSIGHKAPRLANTLNRWADLPDAWPDVNVPSSQLTGHRSIASPAHPHVAFSGLYQNVIIHSLCLISAAHSSQDKTFG
jgi:hypothetical protein